LFFAAAAWMVSKMSVSLVVVIWRLANEHSDELDAAT
jgi:hypothetical protein